MERSYFVLVSPPLTNWYKLACNSQSHTERPETKFKPRDGMNPDSKFISLNSARTDSRLSTSPPLDALFQPWNHIGSTVAGCSLLSDCAFYETLLFPASNQAFHQVACLFAFEEFNLTHHCQPEASSWSHISKKAAVGYTYHF